MDTEVVKRFAAIFRGRTDCWGALHGECIREALTLRHYRQQLTGENSLGIYPLRPDDTCYWGAGDFDDGDVEAPRQLMSTLYDLGVNTGVWLERSKSKGWHVWLFLDAPVPAKDVRLLFRAAMKKANLPLSTEVFPKQDSVADTPDKVGNYLHLPYFGDNGDGRRQFCDVQTLTPIPLEEFLGEHLAFPIDLLPLVVGNLPPELTVAAEGKVLAPEVGEVIPKGQRNETLTSLAGTMRRRGMSHEALLAALQQENELKCQPPLMQADVERIASSVSSYAPAVDKAQSIALTFHRTDAGNGELFAHLYGDRLRYDHRRKRWLLWLGHWWVPDADAEVRRLAKLTARRLYRDAAGVDNLKEREAEARWAIGSESRMRLDATLSLAQAERPIADTGHDWDLNPWLLGVANGVIDLRTGTLHDGRPENRLTMHSPTAYNPDAPCPRWLAFLDRVMAGNEALIDFLQRAVGYSLTGDVSEQVLFFLYGTGANGKSTFLTPILDLLGDYGRQAAPGLLLAKRGERHPTEFADLENARFVSSVEVDQGKRLAEGLVKWLTGGDKMKARKMRQDFYEFRPTYKIWLAANDRPTITGTDLAIWRRIRLVPFTVVIPDPEQDKDLPAKLRGELPGILNWALHGCLAWQRDGLDIPQKVQAATEAYRVEQDILAGFLDDCCTTGSEEKVTANALYVAYTNWCKDSGERPLTKTALGLRLAERGFTPDRTRNEGRFWQGIGLTVTRLAEESNIT